MHTEIQSSELKGRALAWAVCEVYRMPAIIVNEQVHVEVSEGSWQPFDAEAMLRSLVIGLGVATVMVPDEIAS